MLTMKISSATRAGAGYGMSRCNPGTDKYKRFDGAELQRIAASSVGSRTCSCMIKLAAGGSNRIPHPNMGPPFKTTASEVATMDFVRLLMV
ncbi:hypothetical protein I7I48_04645 [Histoplasma ohiense]|nr:hypothetical protein I7I48_04645 [Histoplasma ohiense (nom. inval.)]